MPDDALLDLAAAGRLRQPAVLEAQVRRMLADREGRRAGARTSPGSGCTSATCRTSRPTPTSSRTSTTTCATAFRRETELFFGSIDARGSQRARTADRRLHVRQRAAGEALRHSQRLRQPVPPRDADRATRGAACSARAASCWRRRTPTARRRCCAASGSSRTCSARRRRRRRRTCRRSKRRPRVAAEDHARADGEAPREPGVRRLPSR